MSAIRYPSLNAHERLPPATTSRNMFEETKYTNEYGNHVKHKYMQILCAHSKVPARRGVRTEAA